MMSNSSAMDRRESILFEMEWQFHCKILMEEEESKAMFMLEGVMESRKRRSGGA